MKLKNSKKSKVITKEGSPPSAAPGSVDKILKSLVGLESDIDSLNEKLADMKKQLNLKTQKEISLLNEEVTKKATSEAELIISEAKEKAKSESQRILTNADMNLKDVQNKIDAKFNEAVEHVVSTVLKA